MFKTFTSLSSSISPTHFHPSFPSQHHLKLLSKQQTGLASFLLKFSAPPNSSNLPVPTSVKLIIGNQVKSYSPTNLPAEKLTNSITVPATTIDLLVKPYASSPNPSFSRTLCSLEVGESLPFLIKPNRVIHGQEFIPDGRWDNIFLIGGGTGVAPLIQMARKLVRSNGSKAVEFFSINSSTDDHLMRCELDVLVDESGGGFSCHYTSAESAVELFKRAAAKLDTRQSRQVFVCGSDGFVEYWAGGIVRDKQTNKKIQGDVGGVLGECGYAPQEVYKF